MKRFFSILVLVMIIAEVSSQIPEKMSFQAVIRNSQNQLVKNTTIRIRISILQGSVTGSSVYTETQTPVTNENGLVNIEIGGQTGFSSIDWAQGPFFLKTETDPAGGTDLSIAGTSQFLTVPYALHAKTADAVSATHPLNQITLADINNWKTSYNWGDHSGLYKPISYAPLWTEIISKPDFAIVATSGNFSDLLLKPATLEGYGITNGINTAHPANDISAAMINNWNYAFGWGDHSIAGYYNDGGEPGGANRSLGNTDDYSLSLITGNSSRIFIGNTGNIGIGTNTPSQKLDVAGIVQIRDQAYSPFFNALPGSTHGNSVTIQAGRANGGYGSDLQMSGGSLNGGNVKIEAGSANHFGQGGTVEILAGDAFDTGSRGGNILLKAKGYSQWTMGYIAFFTGGTYSQDLNKPIERMRLAGNGNLGIGTTSPSQSAIVDMSSTTRGFLPPRMTKDQRDAISPVEGLMIYNVSTKKPNFYDGTSWKTFDGTPID